MKILSKILFAILGLGIALPLLLSVVVLVAAVSLVYDMLTVIGVAVIAVVLYVLK